MSQSLKCKLFFSLSQVSAKELVRFSDAYATILKVSPSVLARGTGPSCPISSTPVRCELTRYRLFCVWLTALSLLKCHKVDPVKSMRFWFVACAASHACTDFSILRPQAHTGSLKRREKERKG